MVNINQMKFIVEIVNSNFNLTEAADQLYVSQSALSQFIKKFESENSLRLFERRKGRIVDLTPSGHKVYRQSLNVLDQYYEFEELVADEVKIQKGTVRIGVHSTILRLFFTKFIPQFMSDHPQANIEIVEQGPLTLRKQLLDGRLQMAILIEPTNLDKSYYEQLKLGETEVFAFMDKNHPLANKDKIVWEDFKDNLFITYNKEDPLYDILLSNLKSRGIKAEPLFTSIAFNYIIESLQNSKLIAALPYAEFEKLDQYMAFLNVVIKKIKDPILYVPTIVRPKKQHYSTIESFLYNSITEYFYLDDESFKYKFTND